jgi:predicted nuclease of predicted toxin-antitoxin system
VRFVCDHDVDARVAAVLRRLGHEAWTADQAGLSRAGDDELTVYADERDAVLVSHDREFSRRRSRNVVGRHIFLRCSEWEAADLLVRHLDDVLPILTRKADVWIRLSVDTSPHLSFEWQ